MIAGYLDLPIDEAREQREAHGRAYAAERGLPYPMPPHHYGPGRQPRNRAAHFQRFEAGIAEDEETGRALLLVTDAMEARAGEVVQVDEKPIVLTDTRTKASEVPPEWKEKLDGTRDADPKPIDPKPADEPVRETETTTARTR